MDRIIELLANIIPDLSIEEIKECRALVSEGYLDSFGIVQLVSGIKRTCQISLSVDKLVPENFESVLDIMRMVEAESAETND